MMFHGHFSLVTAVLLLCMCALVADKANRSSIQSGPSCSKLRISLVNDLLKLHQVIGKYPEFFC